MEKLSIIHDEKVLVLDPDLTIEVNEENPLTSNEQMFAGSQFNSDFEYIDYPTEPEVEPMVSVCLSHLRELTPLSEKVGRIGYFQTAKERKEPAFKVGKYEDIKKVWAQTW